MGATILLWSYGFYLSLKAYRYIAIRYSETGRTVHWDTVADGNSPWSKDSYVVGLNKKAKKAGMLAIWIFLSYPMFLILFLILRGLF